MGHPAERERERERERENAQWGFPTIIIFSARRGLFRRRETFPRLTSTTLKVKPRGGQSPRPSPPLTHPILTLRSKLLFQRTTTPVSCSRGPSLLED